jgi:hypothetical protein
MLLLLLLLLAWPSVTQAQLAPVDSNASLRKGLVGQWIAQPPMMGGVTWWPQVGQDKGTLVGMITADAGWKPTARPGGAGEMRFDGSDDRVTVGITGAVAHLNAFSVCLWFRSTSTAVQQLYTESSSPWPDMMLALNWNAGMVSFNNYDFNGSDGIEAFATPPFPVESGIWQHVCAVQFSKSSAQLYVNGLMRANSTGFLGTFPPTARAFGARSGGGNYMAGSLDDIRVYTRPLSASDVAQLYAQSSRKMLQQAVRSQGFLTSSVFRGSLMPFFSLP